jgi:hypothetical protein
MIFNPSSTNKLRSQNEKMIEGLLMQLYLEVNEGVKLNEVIEYMNYYRAQGMISVIQKWVRDGFKTPVEDLIRMMTILDGQTEACFEKWINEKQ